MTREGTGVDTRERNWKEPERKAAGGRKTEGRQTDGPLERAPDGGDWKESGIRKLESFPKAASKEESRLDPYEINFLPEFRKGRGPEEPFVNEFGVVIGDHQYESPDSPLENWSRETDPAIMAGDQWVHPFKDIGFWSEENREYFEQGIPPQGAPFMHPDKDAAYAASLKADIGTGNIGAGNIGTGNTGKGNTGKGNTGKGNTGKGNGDGTGGGEGGPVNEAGRSAGDGSAAAGRAGGESRNGAGSDRGRRTEPGTGGEKEGG